MHTITYTALTTYQRCPREYLYRYVHGLTTPPTDSQSLGTAIHQAIDTGTLPSTGDSYIDARASAMWVGYQAHWERHPWTVVQAEHEFCLPLRNRESGRMSRTWQLAGKIDAIVRDPQNRLWIVEHKTTSQDITTGSAYWQTLSIDSQLDIYLQAARTLGYEPEGCIYNVLAKPQIRPLLATPDQSRRYNKDGSLDKRQRLTDETPRQYLDRCIDLISKSPAYYYARHKLCTPIDTSQDRWHTCQAIHASEVSGIWNHHPGACRRYGSLCPYFPICSGMCGMDDSRYTAVDSPHTEFAPIRHRESLSSGGSTWTEVHG